MLHCPTGQRALQLQCYFQDLTPSGVVHTLVPALPTRTRRFVRLLQRQVRGLPFSVVIEESLFASAFLSSMLINLVLEKVEVMPFCVCSVYSLLTITYLLVTHYL